MVDLSIAFSQANPQTSGRFSTSVCLTIFDVEENHYLIQFSWRLSALSSGTPIPVFPAIAAVLVIPVTAGISPKRAERATSSSFLITLSRCVAQVLRGTLASPGGCTTPSRSIS